ncbi:hypothetical protein LOK46_13315 [Methylobacterium sp. NMS14P]|uniref:hypothetical protein n=1 Tax=Methylobacterium sp. NMS14P TaxID=2894310 RepID=UPI00235880D2|nr:hypothetical protein [Methylobacterium sp. NMS14P]WCS27753.1 hypothetical protein LOK46_13315 [Methylobacterium sp. NMS14P]
MPSLFAFAVEREYLQADSTRGVKLLNVLDDRTGYHTWTDDEIGRFEVCWPLGTRERLALDLRLYTGLRHGDAARVGPQHAATVGSASRRRRPGGRSRSGSCRRSRTRSRRAGSAH